MSIVVSQKGFTDEDLEIAFNKVKTPGDWKARINASTLQIGDDVRLSGLWPKYLNNLSGYVQLIDGTKVHVTLHPPSAEIYQRRGNYGSTLIVPAQCCTKEG